MLNQWMIERERNLIASMDDDVDHSSFDCFTKESETSDRVYVYPLKFYILITHSPIELLFSPLNIWV